MFRNKLSKRDLKIIEQIEQICIDSSSETVKSQQIRDIFSEMRHQPRNWQSHNVTKIKDKAINIDGIPDDIKLDLLTTL